MLTLIAQKGMEVYKISGFLFICIIGVPTDVNADYVKNRTVLDCFGEFAKILPKIDAASCEDKIAFSNCLLGAGVDFQNQVSHLKSIFSFLSESDNPKECSDNHLDDLIESIVEVLENLLDDLGAGFSSLTDKPITPLDPDIVNAKAECRKEVPLITPDSSLTCKVTIDYIKCILQKLGLAEKLRLNKDVFQDVKDTLVSVLARYTLVCTPEIENLTSMFRRQRTSIDKRTTSSRVAKSTTASFTASQPTHPNTKSIKTTGTEPTTETTERVLTTTKLVLPITPMTYPDYSKASVYIDCTVIYDAGFITCENSAGFTECLVRMKQKDPQNFPNIATSSLGSILQHLEAEARDICENYRSELLVELLQDLSILSGI